MLLVSLLSGAVAGLFDRRALMSIIIMTGMLLAAAVGMALDGDVLGGLTWFFANLALFEMALVGVGVLVTFHALAGETPRPWRFGLGRAAGQSIASTN